MPVRPPLLPVRRRLAVGAATALALPLLLRPARAAGVLSPMTEGPFYPAPAWRERGPFAGDWDADLTQVRRAGRTRVAQGEHLALALVVQDRAGRAIDGAQVEIWQCDATGRYRHPRDGARPAEVDEGFQGYGEALSGAGGTVAFRTIRPVPYPGRTPHIHVKLRHASFGEITSQLFVDGEPGNASDFLWRRLGEAGRAALALRLERSGDTSAAADGLAWRARHTLVLPT